MFLQLILIGILVDDMELRSGRKAWIRNNTIVCVAMLLGFAAFQPYLALRGALIQQKSDRDERTGLYYPTLSATSSGALSKSIRAQLNAGDVVVPASYWLGMESWFAFDQRLLPLTNFYEPLLATHGRDGANYHAERPFWSTRPVRVVLILADPYQELGVLEWNERIKRRFPQASEWRQLLMAESTGTKVWSTTLGPPFGATEPRPRPGAR